jgi:hypothetical protein
MWPWAASDLRRFSMNGKRLALAVLMVAAIVAAVGGPSSSTGQTQDPPGVTYGGVKDQDPAWLRLDGARRSIAALHIEWAAAPERCSNRKVYFGTLYAGYEWNSPIPVDERGRFNKVIVDRYPYAGGRYVETQAVSGTIAGHVATGTISGRARGVRPGGQVVRCTFGPQRWRLTD